MSKILVDTTPALYDLEVVMFLLRHDEQGAARRYFNDICFKKYNAAMHQGWWGTELSTFFFSVDEYFNNQSARETLALSHEELVNSFFNEVMDEYEKHTGKPFVHIDASAEMAVS